MRERRAVLAVFALANLGYFAYDALRLHPLPLLVIVGRSGIELAMLAILALLKRPRALVSDPRPLLRVVCCIALANWFLITAGAGGPSSAYFAMVPAFPLIYAAAFPDDPVGALINAALALAGGLVMLRLAGARPAYQIEWAGVACFLGVSAYAGAYFASRRTSRELGIEKARRQAVEQLSRSEKRRAAAERLAIVGQLAAGVAHEINNPLSYVKSNLRWLEAAASRVGADAELTEVIADSVAGINHIAQVVTDLREFARDTPDDAELCEAAGLVDEALRLASVRLKGAADLVRRVEEGMPAILVPRRRLLQALVNILVNAADAVQRSSTGIASGTRPWIRVEARRGQGCLQFEVEDSGPGVDARAREHLFEPFFTTKGVNGTGLGLPISLENVKRCGGTLEAGTGPGGGALFTIRIAVPAAGRLERAVPPSLVR